jgi:hypothetical protein
MTEPSLPADVSVLGEITPEMLEETFPEWRVFEQRGLWWAVRPGVRADAGPESLLLRTIARRELTGLAESLCVQRWLELMSAEELAGIWRDGVLPPLSDVPLPMLVPDEP